MVSSCGGNESFASYLRFEGLLARGQITHLLTRRDPVLTVSLCRREEGQKSPNVAQPKLVSLVTVVCETDRQTERRDKDGMTCYALRVLAARRRASDRCLG